MTKTTRRRLTDLSVNCTATPQVLAAANSGDRIHLIDPHDIDPSTGIHDRMDLGDVEGLAGSIRDNGQDTPITVRIAPTTSAFSYEIVSGRRRLHAIHHLNRTADQLVPVRAVVVELNERELAVAQVRENALRENYTFAEQIRAVARLNALGVTGGEAAAALGIHKSTASRLKGMAPIIGCDVLRAFGRSKGLGRASFERLVAALLAGLPALGAEREDELERRRVMVADLVTAHTNMLGGDEVKLLKLALMELDALAPREDVSTSPEDDRLKPTLAIAERDGCLVLEYRISDDPASRELARDEMMKAQVRFEKRLREVIEGAKT